MCTSRFCSGVRAITSSVWLWLPLLVSVLIIAAACSGGSSAPEDLGSGGGSDEDRIRALVQHEADLYNDGNYEALYQLSSPQSLPRCSQEQFATYLEQNVKPVLGGKKLSIQVVSVTAVGNVANATFDDYADGQLRANGGSRFVK